MYSCKCCTHLPKGMTMQVEIENAQNYRGSLDDNFPPNLIRFRMDAKTPFYDNKDYIYEFKENGKSRTTLKPLGIHAYQNELNRQTRLQIKGFFRPKIERPHARLKRLAEDIFSTEHIDQRGGLDGIVWPISFVSRWELHVIKLPLVSLDEVEPKVLVCIASHFQVSSYKLNAHHVS